MITICKRCRKIIWDDGGIIELVMVGELCHFCQEEEGDKK